LAMLLSLGANQSVLERKSTILPTMSPPKEK
jgi:hypothetical protein